MGARFFSADYQEAREKFLAAAEAAGAVVDSARNPHPGPDGKALFTDVALLGPGEAERCLVVQSGTHGGEGFAGSAIQTALLEDAALGQLISSVRLVLIHAINPWGFAHLRRTNEDNVDLNRNFVDRAKPYPANPGYERLAPIFEPSRLSPFTRLTRVVRLLGYGATHGAKALQYAVTGGQYSHPQGLFFGGHFDVWSNKVFRRILSEHVAGTQEVAFIDLHTGLGASGHAEMIVIEPVGSPDYRRALDWWGDRVKSTKADESLSADVTGTLKSAVTEALQGSTVTAGTLEIGTLSSYAVLEALIEENWLHHHVEPDDPRFPIMKAAFRKAFVTETDEWQRAVLSHGREVILQAFAGLVARSMG